MFKKLEPRNALSDRVKALAGRNALDHSTSKTRPTRQAVFRNGVAVLDGGARVSVIFRDLIDGGARIEFAARMELPDEFVLSEPSSKLRRRARLIWRGQGAAGVQFCD